MPSFFLHNPWDLVSSGLHTGKEHESLCIFDQAKTNEKLAQKRFEKAGPAWYSAGEGTAGRVLFPSPAARFQVSIYILKNIKKKIAM